MGKLFSRFVAVILVIVMCFSISINAVDVVLTINSYAAFGPYAAQLSALVSTVSMASSIQVWQIEHAASLGTGIIMSTYDDGTTAVPLITYSPQ